MSLSLLTFVHDSKIESEDQDEPEILGTMFC